MLPIPTKEHALTRFIHEMIESCMATAAGRASECRLINAIVETGRTDGAKSKMNLLYNHLDRLAAYLYSPTDLRFTIDYENDYPESVYQQSAVVARGLTRDWERNNIDTEFGAGVFEGLKYGSSILKQWTEEDDGGDVNFCKRLVNQWNLGVYTEDENDLSKQECVVERMYITMPEVWRRIYRLPGAKDLYKRIESHERSGESDWGSQSYFHQVLSVSALNTSSVNNAPPPGGIVDLANNQNYSMMSPSVQAGRVMMHELWVKGENDYVTLQMIEPDIIIAPYRKDGVVMRMQNLLIPGDVHTGRNPYTLIQPNQMRGYIWGRSEIMDLVELQMTLSQDLDDAQRLLGIQIDKILGFTGVDGMTDERYDQFRGAGWASAPQGATIQDLTPQFPPELLNMVKFKIEQMNFIGGFSELMQGRGESGVRAGTHANTLLKTGSPRLRDRSLIVERQAATAADLTLLLKTAKDGDQYWTKGDTFAELKNTSFRLTDLPDDRRVAVDSHSSSPIFADDHQQLTAFGIKAGYLDGEDALDDLPYPNRERKKQRLRMRQMAKQKQLEQLKQQDPESYAKLLSHGGKR
jgi:hypothetical protein